MAEIHLEMYEDAFQKRAELLRKLKDPDSVLSIKEANEMQTQLAALNRSLGQEEEVADELIDKWERELAEGKTPNLDE